MSDYNPRYNTAVPFTEEHPEKSKRGLYVIGDPFVSFWCRFILPHQSLLQAGQGETVWRELIDTHLGLVFEQVCRQYVLHRWAEEHGATPVRVGHTWAADHDVDVMAELVSDKRRWTLVGECKWWKSPVGANMLRDLSRKAAALPTVANREAELALFSLSGFTDEAKAAAKRGEVTLVSGAEVLGNRP
jgi:uncharacterized protein